MPPAPSAWTLWHLPGLLGIGEPPWQGSGCARVPLLLPVDWGMDARKDATHVNTTLTRRVPALLVSATLLASLLVAGLATPVTAASPTACRVTNPDTGVVRNSLQKAVWQARSGQRLIVRGTCHGRTKIGKNLHISGVRRGSSGRPTLDGDAKGSVVSIKLGARVTLKDLQIRDGFHKWGGGVRNKGILTLAGSTTIRGNEGLYGGGAWNSGTLKLTGSSAIRANKAQVQGGGVRNFGTLTLRNSSAIRGNETDRDGGGVYNGGGTVTLKHSSKIDHNRSPRAGGGIMNTGDGTVTLMGSSSIFGNEAVAGGGILTEFGTIRLKHSSSIHHNSASAVGGGIFDNRGDLYNVNCGGNVHNNSPDDCSSP